MWLSIKNNNIHVITKVLPVVVGNSVVVGSSVVGGVVTVVGTGVVVQFISSSGQSTTPSHQDVELMQTLVVGHSTEDSGQGLHTQPHEAVNTPCNP